MCQHGLLNREGDVTGCRECSYECAQTAIPMSLDPQQCSQGAELVPHRPRYEAGCSDGSQPLLRSPYKRLTYGATISQPPNYQNKGRDNVVSAFLEDRSGKSLEKQENIKKEHDH